MSSPSPIKSQVHQEVSHIHFLQLLYCSFTRQFNDVMTPCGQQAAGRPLFSKGVSAAAESLTRGGRRGRGGGAEDSYQ